MEIPGFSPSRQEVQLPDGTWKVSVTPPTFMGLPTQAVILSPSQYEAYLRWRRAEIMIQEALPELSAAYREILMTGIGPTDWKEMWKDDD